jgi:hypothetical protein
MIEQIEQIINECSELSGKDACIVYSSRRDEDVNWTWLAYLSGCEGSCRGNSAYEAASKLRAKCISERRDLEESKNLIAKTLGIHP